MPRDDGADQALVANARRRTPRAPRPRRRTTSADRASRGGWRSARRPSRRPSRRSCRASQMRSAQFSSTARARARRRSASAAPRECACRAPGAAVMSVISSACLPLPTSACAALTMAAASISASASCSSGVAEPAMMRTASSLPSTVTPASASALKTASPRPPSGQWSSTVSTWPVSRAAVDAASPCRAA